MFVHSNVTSEKETFVALEVKIFLSSFNFNPKIY